MKKTDLLCFSLPTCDPDDMLMHLIPSLNNLGKLKDYCSFGIIFQPPYTEIQMNEVINVFKNQNLEFKYSYKEYEFDLGETPLNRMRQDASMMYPNSLFYGILDDDMEFLDGIDLQYLDLIYLMLKYRNLSVASLDAAFIDSDIENEFKINLGDLNNTSLYTKSGLIVRGGIYYGFTGLLPEELVSLVGGRQDVITAVYRLIQGDSIITCDNGKCLHYEYRETPGYDEYLWFDSTVPNTNTDWLEEHGYTRHLKLNEKNFLDETYEELLNIGCLDFNITALKLINSDDYSIEEIDDLILNLYESNELNSNLFKIYDEYTGDIIEYNDPKILSNTKTKSKCYAEIISDKITYSLRSQIVELNSEFKVLDKNSVFKLEIIKVNTETNWKQTKAVLLVDYNEFEDTYNCFCDINNKNLNNWLENEQEWSIVLRLINYAKQYINTLINKEEL